MLIVTVDVVFAAELGDAVRQAFRVMDEETAKEPGCLKGSVSKKYAKVI